MTGFSATLGLDDRGYERGLRRAVRESERAGDAIERNLTRTTATRGITRATRRYAQSIRDTGRQARISFGQVQEAVNVAATSAAAGFGAAALAVGNFAESNRRVQADVNRLTAEVGSFVDELGRDLSNTGVVSALREAVAWAGDLRSSVSDVVAQLAGLADGQSLLDQRRAQATEARLEAEFRESRAVLSLDRRFAQERTGLGGGALEAQIAAIEDRFDGLIEGINGDESLSGQQRSLQVERFNTLRRELIDAAERRAEAERERARIAEDAARLERGAAGTEELARQARAAGRDAQADQLDAIARSRRERARLTRTPGLSDREREIDEERIERRLALDTQSIRRREAEETRVDDERRRAADRLAEVETERFRIATLRAEGRRREADLAQIELDRAERIARFENDAALSAERREDAIAAANTYFDGEAARTRADRAEERSFVQAGQSVRGLSRFTLPGARSSERERLNESKRQTEVLERIEQNTATPPAAVLG